MDLIGLEILGEEYRKEFRKLRSDKCYMNLKKHNIISTVREAYIHARDAYNGKNEHVRDWIQKDIESVRKIQNSLEQEKEALYNGGQCDFLWEDTSISEIKLHEIEKMLKERFGVIPIMKGEFLGFMDSNQAMILEIPI